MVRMHLLGDMLVAGRQRVACGVQGLAHVLQQLSIRCESLQGQQEHGN